MEEEKVEKNNLEEIMKDSTLLNPELTFCEKTIPPNLSVFFSIFFS